LRRAAAGTAALLLLSCTGPGGTVLAPRLTVTGLPPIYRIEEVPFFPQTEYHCGPAALATILVFNGVDTDPETLAPMVYLPGRRGTLTVEMAAAGRRLGRMPYLLDGTMESLVAEVAVGRPVVVLLNLGVDTLPHWHYAVVVGYDGLRDNLLLRSGRQKEETMAAARFMKTWEGSGFWAMVVVVPGEVPATVQKIPYFRQTVALDSTGMPKKAEASWRRAAVLWPESPTPHLGLGNTLTAQGRLEEAEEAFRFLLARDPDSVEGQNNLAHVLSLRGCHREASLVIEEALRQASRTDLESIVTATREEIRERREEGSEGDCGK
jgi:hypothetical protein